MSSVTSDAPGKRLTDLLNDMLLDPVRDVTPDMLTVVVEAHRTKDRPTQAATNVRNAVLALLQDMVPCPKLRAICSNAPLSIAYEEHVLDFCPLAQHAAPLKSSVALHEENVGPYREGFRPRIEALWTELVASANKPAR
jgi:hypothetical protein